LTGTNPRWAFVGQVPGTHVFLAAHISVTAFHGRNPTVDGVRCFLRVARDPGATVVDTALAILSQVSFGPLLARNALRR